MVAATLGQRFSDGDVKRKDPMIIDADGHILEPPDLWDK
jgi:hypothetical protein